MLQFPVNIVQITSHKMMQTNGKKQNRLRMVLPFIQHIRHTLDGNILQIAA